MRTWLWDLVVLLGVLIFIIGLMLLIQRLIMSDWPFPREAPARAPEQITGLGASLVIIGLVARKLLDRKPKSSADHH
jgi:hypothetical protein